MFTFALLPSSAFFFLLYVLYKYTANHALLIVPLHKRRASAARPRLPPFAPALIPRSSSLRLLLLLLRPKDFRSLPTTLHFFFGPSLSSLHVSFALPPKKAWRERGTRPLFPLSFILVPFPSLCIEPQRTRQLGEEGWRRDQGKERPPILQPKRGSFGTEFSSTAVSIRDSCKNYNS